jgi:curli biogenesis system outer membrane secretion channel CsgG
MKPLLSLVLVLAMAAASPAPAAPAAPAPSDGPSQALHLKRAVTVEDFQGAEVMGAAATSLTAILVDDLMKDGRFVVIEKPSASVQASQAAAAATAQAPDADKAATAALVPNIIVRGTITKFEAAARGNGLTVGGMPMGSRFGGGAAGVNGQRAIVELTLRLVDGTTGQVLASAHGNGSAGTRTLQAGATDARTGATLAGTNQKATPIQKAADEAIRKAIGELGRAAERTPWSALVIDVEDNAVYINAGSDENVPEGLTMSVWRNKKVLTDPVSGAVLDVLVDRVGSVQVTEVRAKTSTAKALDGAAPQKGDLVKVP